VADVVAVDRRKTSHSAPTHVLLTATHTHSAGGQRGPDYAQKIVEAVRLATQRLTRPASGMGR
jgi:hypothetical protein